MEKSLLLLAVLLFCSSDALRKFGGVKGQKDFPPQIFAQKLDHFDPLETRTFPQRFYVNDLYHSGPNAPVILYINGEGPVYGPPSLPNDEVVLLAQDLGARIVTLEHRYYGMSVPFKTLETENLQWLTTQQALADLAHFITDFTQSPVITIGCSYSGALSAWFRLKYPQITRGSVSSSGVVNAILDFTAFDEQVSASAGFECSAALILTTQILETLIFSNISSLVQDTKERFNASMLTDDGDFFYLMADIMAESIQYGYQDELCVPMVKDFEEGGVHLVGVFANYTNNFWYHKLGSAKEYSTADQQNTTVAEDRAYRQWWFQKCSQLAYFQNAPAEGSIRSSIVNMDYHRRHCREVFGRDLWPDTEATNTYYGGNQTAATNIFFANGSQDPWQHASVTSSLSVSEPAKVIHCHNCGHCVDVRGCPGGCAGNELQETREMIKKVVRSWLQ